MTIEINKERYLDILKDIVRIPSPSGNEGRLAKHLIEKYSGSDSKWIGIKDGIHNVYFKKRTDEAENKKLPLLLAHIDTVESPHNCRDDFREIIENEHDFLRLHADGLLKKQQDYQNDVHAGFDDKAGVAAIVYLMKYSELDFRAIFTVQEESTSQCLQAHQRDGGGGIEYVLRNENNDTFGEVFSATSFVISLDRKNGNDIINSYGNGIRRERLQLCSDHFLESLKAISNSVRHPMEAAEGTVADIYNIKYLYRDLNCVNLSIGFENDHHGNDALDIDSAMGVMKVVAKCVKLYSDVEMVV